MPKVQSSEIAYELHSLGWKAFQNLCATIVTEIWGQTIQTFFDSYDGGRDGAFNGEWKAKDGEIYSGSFTVQCKFTSKSDKSIILSDLTDEIGKAARLAKKGLADNYFLFTNTKLVGVNDESIKDRFESIPELKKCTIFGKERISQIIHESSRLRMLVPRVYGLGDLSQILDERAYSQSREILSSLGDDLAKFIVTDAFKQSARALVKHGFVLLLGAPMCGKSTIAAALAMGALDNWGCSTIKVRDADDFVKHFNPYEKQLFWVDDAFGPTQIDWSSAINWNRTFPHVNAAINKGSKVIFTSRDYVYRSAKRQLKESAIPIMKESQVVIQVENISIKERKQILYNHIKLGTQKKSYKQEIKPFLQDVANHKKFSPEIARRLGNPLFTKELNITKCELSNFVDNPLEMLCEVINTIDDSSRSALTAVFIRGGRLPSPLKLTQEEAIAISRIGGTISGTIKGLEDLNGSLLLSTIKDGEHYWHFKHPTIRDAYAKTVAYSPDLMDIYLTGAPLEQLFSEISCGDLGIKGVSVIVPTDQYPIIIKKIIKYDISKWYNKSSLYRFLTYRCDKDFLVKYLEVFPKLISKLSVGSYIWPNPDVDLLARFHEFELVPEDYRVKVVNSFKELAVDVPDSGFLREPTKLLMTSNELSEIIDSVRNDLIPNLERTIDEWKYNYDSDVDPDSYFEELISALDDYKCEFEGDPIALKKISFALSQISEIIEELKDDYSPDSKDSWWTSETKATDPTNNRSIFDDVDQ
jgi:hypothetical protein